MFDREDIQKMVRAYVSQQHDFRIFMNGVLSYIGDHPELNQGHAPVIHSYKSRLKDPNHLDAKLVRKMESGREITLQNLFGEVTDLAGVRFLHLFQEGFGSIDEIIRKKVDSGDWHLSERPKAYTWDPEAVAYFGQFDLEVVEKATSYTSVHYLIRPRIDSPICCEVQVRTLFEEIWGEVDHRINYPVPSTSVACREQLKVLSKIVGAGSRLLDALDRVQRADQILQNLPVLQAAQD